MAANRSGTHEKDSRIRRQNKAGRRGLAGLQAFVFRDSRYSLWNTSCSISRFLASWNGPVSASEIGCRHGIWFCTWRATNAERKSAVKRESNTSGGCSATPTSARPSAICISTSGNWPTRRIWSSRGRETIRHCAIRAGERYRLRWRRKCNHPLLRVVGGPAAISARTLVGNGMSKPRPRTDPAAVAEGNPR